MVPRRRADLRGAVRRPDGARLAYRVTGPYDARPLLLLQGQANGQAWWDRLRDDFADDLAISVDYRGTGASMDTGPSGWSTASFADDAAAVLAALGHAVADVYGTSMGGRVAQELAPPPSGQPGRSSRPDGLVWSAAIWNQRWATPAVENLNCADVLRNHSSEEQRQHTCRHERAHSEDLHRAAEHLPADRPGIRDGGASRHTEGPCRLSGRRTSWPFFLHRELHLGVLHRFCGNHCHAFPGNDIYAIIEHMSGRWAVVGGGGTTVRPDLAALTAALGRIETSVTGHDEATDGAADRARVDLIRELEQLRCATEAAQAALTVEFADSQASAQAAAGVPAARQGRGVAAQVGLARRESVHRATFHLSLARLVIGDLPHVAAAWRAGRITEYRVQKIAAAACVLARPERLALDARLAGTPDLTDALEGLGDRAVEARANEVAYDLDKLAYLARRARAVTERHTSLRPAPDGMTWFSALVSLKDGVSMHASLTAAATAARSAGDPRSRGQVMADVLVDRVTGRTTNAPVPVHVEIVVPVDVATGVGDHAGATCWAPAYGPVPADVAREWAETASQAGAATYTRIWADAPTGQVIGTESRSAARAYPHSLATYARRRDRVCRVPWCDAPVRHIDHSTDHAHGGETSTHNAGGLCEAHNHAKQAPGWTATPSQDPDGTHTITYTTPTGHTHTSRPPPSYPPRE